MRWYKKDTKILLKNSKLQRKKEKKRKQRKTNIAHVGQKFRMNIKFFEEVRHMNSRKNNTK